MTLVNLDPSNKISLRTTLHSINWTKVEGQILSSAKITDVNTFEKPNLIKPVAFSGAKKEGTELVVDLPAQSLVLLTIY